MDIDPLSHDNAFLRGLTTLLFFPVLVWYVSSWELIDRVARAYSRYDISDRLLFVLTIGTTLALQLLFVVVIAVVWMHLPR